MKHNRKWWNWVWVWGVALSVAGTARATGLLSNVPEAANYRLVYEFPIPTNSLGWNAVAVPYSVDNSSNITHGSFSRVAYYMELVTTGGATQWVYVSMSAFTTNASKLGVPTTGSGEFYHYPSTYHTAAPTNATILSNLGTITQGTGINTINLEFWPSSFTATNQWAVPGANNATYDFGDGGANTSSGHGSMQVHNYGAGQTLFAYNAWGTARLSECGVGNGATPDWTSTGNATTFSQRTLQILVGNGGEPAITNQPVTGLAPHAAVLSAGLSSTGAEAAVVTLYWGTNDAGVVATNWPHANPFPGTQVPGTVSTNLGGLADRTVYTYRFLASNSFGVAWTPAVTFTTRTDFAAWNRKVPITFSGYNRAETLTDFPVLMILGTNVDGFSYGQFQSGSNADLVFSDSSQSNELSYEVDQWNTNGLSYVWVRVPQVVDSNTAIWAYWGRNGLTPPAYTTNGSVWGNAYAGVWHLSESSGARYDSAALLANGTPSGTIAKVTGAMGNADRYYYTDGDDYVTISNSVARLENVQETNFTLEAWFKPLSTPPGTGSSNDANYGIIMKTGNHEGLKYQANNTFRFDHWLAGSEVGIGSVRAVAPGSFHHVVAVLDRGAGRTAIYVDGLLEATNTFAAGAATFEYNQNPWRLGIANPGAATYRWDCDGAVDEARISSVARSANWIWASWLGMASNATLLTYGRVGLPTVRAVAATNVTAVSANLNGYLVSTGLAPTTVRVYWGTNDGNMVAANWANTNDFGVRDAGPVTLNVGLAPGALYFYRYYVTNSYGEGWSPTAEPVGAQEVTVQATDPVASENGPDPAAFTVSRPSWATAAPLSVSYTLTGSAVNGVDYINLTGSVTIPAGSASADVVVTPIFDQNYLEDTETVVMALSPGGYLIGSANTATATIANYQTASVALVSGTGNDTTGDGSVYTPFRSLTRALTNTPAYSLIYVGSGTYTTNSGEVFPLAIASGTSLIGLGTPADAVIDAGRTNRGFALGSGTATNVIRNLSLIRTRGTAMTIDNWQGSFENMVISDIATGTAVAVQNCSILYCTNGATRNITFSGVLFTNIISNVDRFWWFRGIGTVTFTNCTFRNLSSTVALSGSGAFLCTKPDGSVANGVVGYNALFSDCLIDGLTMPGVATDQTGVFVTGFSSTLTFERCIVRAVTLSGQGINLFAPNRGTGYARNCLFYNLQCGTSYAAISGFRSTNYVRNCTFYNVNTVFRPTGDAATWGTLAYDTLVSGCSTLNRQNMDLLYLYNVNLHNTSNGVGYSVANSTNVTFLDPWFVDAANSNLHLRSFSPMVDAGNNSYVQGSLDVARTARIQDGDGDNTATVDVGAYECDFLNPSVPRFRTPVPVYQVNAGQVLQLPVWIQPAATGAVNAKVTYGTDVSGTGTLSFASGSETGTLSITVASPLTVTNGALVLVSISETGTTQGVAMGDIGLHLYSSVVTVPGYQARAFVRAGTTNQFVVQLPDDTMQAGSDITVTVGGVSGAGTNSVQWIGSNIITAGGWRTAGYLQVVGAGGENTITLSIGSGMTFTENNGSSNLTFDFVGYSSPLYVAPSGSDTTGLGTPGAPLRTVTFASPLLRAGDEIRASAGLYSTNSGEAFPVAVAEGIALRGVIGPNGNETDSTLIDADGNGFGIQLGTLASDPGARSGGGVYNVIVTDAKGTAIRARYWGGTISNCVIRNVMNGAAQDSTALIRVENGGRNTFLYNVTATNISTSAGLLIYMSGGSSVTLRNCLFKGITVSGTHGNGVFAFDDHTTDMADCIFDGITFPGPAAAEESGFLRVINNPVTIDRCIFRNLSVSSGQDPVLELNRNPTAVVRNSLFHNINTGNGRGVIGHFRSNPEIRNCTIDRATAAFRVTSDLATSILSVYNSSVSSCTNLNVQNGTRLRFYNVNLYDTAAGAGYDTNSSVSVTAFSPAYRNPVGGDYRSRDGGPLIDAGNTAYMQGSFDLDLMPRRIGRSVDLGPYETMPNGTSFSIR